MAESLLRKMAASILPRRRAVALLALLLAGSALLAQYRSKRSAPHVLRALGVLEWPADHAGTPRLVPLVILAQGKYYDASIYEASPVPLAVDPGTVYEIQQSGAPKGLFTITAAQEVPEKEIWYGVGTWAEGAAGTSAVAPREEDRPVLRRAKPGTGAPTTSGQAAPPLQAPTEAQIQSDTDRPMLHRGKPAAQPPAAAPLVGKKAAPLPAPAAAPAATAASRWMVAISDAQPSESRSYVLNWTAGEEAKLSQRMVALAQAEIAKYTLFPSGQHAVPGTLADLQVRFFDLYIDNSPEIVLTARQPAGTYAAAATSRRGRRQAPPGSAHSQPEIYITLVARADLDGNLRKIFASVTDSGRLDVVPRLELIDAVDTDGQGVGELLFRKIGRGAQGLEGNAVIYRVDPDQLTEIFDSWGQ